MKGGDLETSALDSLLGLWRGDPFTLHAGIAESQWDQLRSGRDELIAKLEELSTAELRELSNLDQFGELFPSLGGLRSVRPATDGIANRRRLLIVDDEIAVTTTLRAILQDCACIAVTTLEDAMQVLMDQDVVLDGAIVDLHLSKARMDSAGLEILSFIREHRPDLPRVLLTASPPAGSVDEKKRKYGLVDIIVKGADGYSIEGLRDVVERMLGDSDDSKRSRSVAAFENHAAMVEQQITRELVKARRDRRTGTTESNEGVEHWTALLDDFYLDLDGVRAELQNAPTAAGAEQMIDGFDTRWGRMTEAGE